MTDTHGIVQYVDKNEDKDTARLEPDTWGENLMLHVEGKLKLMQRWWNEAEEIKLRDKYLMADGVSRLRPTATEQK